MHPFDLSTQTLFMKERERENLNTYEMFYVVEQALSIPLTYIFNV